MGRMRYSTPRAREIKTRISDTEHAQLLRAADDRGMSIATFVRTLLLEYLTDQGMADDR